MSMAQSQEPHSRTQTNQERLTQSELSYLTGEVTESNAQGGENPELTLDVIFQILKNSRRRLVLQYLRDNGGTSTLSDVAEHIAAIENGINPEQLNSDQRKRVYVGLYQCHLPKMDEAGVIDYNQSRGNIELTELTEHFEEYLEDPDEDPTTRRWYQYYAVISVVGLSVLLLTALLPNTPVAAVPLVSASVIGLVTTCSIGHWWATRDDVARE
jgi:hypothetical protein